MTARRCLSLLAVAALVCWCPGCACAPDRWTVGARAVSDPRTGEWRASEVNAQLSGPLPLFRSHE